MDKYQNALKFAMSFAILVTAVLKFILDITKK